MKTYIFEVVIEEGYDEFWESNPTVTDMEILVKEAINNYFDGNATVKLKKYENEN